MPDGSSSDAPVMRPGPSALPRRFTEFLSACSSAALGSTGRLGSTRGPSGPAGASCWVIPARLAARPATPFPGAYRAPRRPRGRPRKACRIDDARGVATRLDGKPTRSGPCLLYTSDAADVAQALLGAALD